MSRIHTTEVRTLQWHQKSWPPPHIDLGEKTLGLGETTLTTQALTEYNYHSKGIMLFTSLSSDRVHLVVQAHQLVQQLSNWKSHCLATVRSRQPMLSPKSERTTEPTKQRIFLVLSVSHCRTFRMTSSIPVVKPERLWVHPSW